MITSKLTSKAQTTIPQPVRAALGVAEGDEVAYTIEPGRVILRKAPARPGRGGPLVEDPFGTFTEWDSDADRAAFADL
jgi:antitoxin PrlF